MTTKEMAIQNVEYEIEKKEQELEIKKQELAELQEKISTLKKKLEEYRNISDSYCNTILISSEDFPLARHWLYDISKQITFDKYATINDLIHSSPKELLKIRGLGKARLKLIEEWMEKHELHFIS